MTCIYAIFNVANGKLYIGQSVDHKIRWKNHIVELNSDIHHNSYLQNLWHKDVHKLELKLEEMINNGCGIS